MTNQHRFKVAKLIRNKLPEIMRSKDIKRLKEKLSEEVEEVLAADPTNLQEELADVLEVIMALNHAYELNFEDIEVIRAKKKSEKGGFDTQIYVDYVEIDSANPSITYYFARPEQYPELP